MKQRPVLIVIAAAIWVALAACSPSYEGGSGDGDKVEESKAPAPSPSETTPSGKSEEKGSKETKLDAATKAKIEGAVGTYLNTLDQAYKSGETSKVKGLALKECGFCNKLVGYIEDVYGKGGRVEGSQAGEPQNVTVSGLSSFEGIEQVHFSAKVRWTAVKAYNKSGKVIDQEPAGVESVRFTLQRSGAEWKIRTWELQ